MTREISRLFSFHFFHFKGFLTSFEMTVQLLFVDGVDWRGEAAPILAAFLI